MPSITPPSLDREGLDQNKHLCDVHAQLGFMEQRFGQCALQSAASLGLVVQSTIKPTLTGEMCFSIGVLELFLEVFCSYRLSPILASTNLKLQTTFAESSPVISADFAQPQRLYILHQNIQGTLVETFAKELGTMSKNNLSRLS